MTAPVVERRRTGPAHLAGFAALLAGVSLALATLSAYPWVASAPDAALVKVAFKHVASHAGAGRAPLSGAELEGLPRHMRPQSAERARTGSRRDTALTVVLDGRVLLQTRYRPGGLRRDGPTFAYEELPVRPGPHRLEITLAEAGRPEGDAPGPGLWRLLRELDVRPAQVVLVELQEDAGLTIR